MIAGQLYGASERYSGLTYEGAMAGTVSVLVVTLRVVLRPQKRTAKGAGDGHRGGDARECGLGSDALFCYREEVIKPKV